MTKEFKYSNFERIDNSRPPLRWFANLMGDWAGFHIPRSVYAQEAKKDFTAKTHAYFYRVLSIPYKKWGTYYKYNIKEN